MIYKLVDLSTHDLWLGNEKAIIDFANKELGEINVEGQLIWKNEELKEIGCVVSKEGLEVEDINNIDLAIKFLQRIRNYAVVDLGNILDDLENDELILLSQEE